MKKIFITGHSGMVGKHLLKRLSDSDILLYNRDQDFQPMIDFQPDIIYHLAAEIYDQKAMFSSNVELTHGLLEAAKQLPNLRAFVYIGSSSEYGRKDHPMSETDFLDPTTLYEATKGAGTLMCQAYFHEYEVPTVVARPFSLYGEYEPQHRFIPTIIRSLRNNKIIKLAEGVHDFIHVDDFISGLFLLENAPKGQVYNFGTGVQTSNKELVNIIASIMGKEPKISKINALHTYDSQCWVANWEKAASLHWEPKLSLLQGLTLVVNQLKE